MGAAQRVAEQLPAGTQRYETVNQRFGAGGAGAGLPKGWIEKRVGSGHTLWAVAAQPEVVTPIRPDLPADEYLAAIRMGESIGALGAERQKGKSSGGSRKRSRSRTRARRSRSYSPKRKKRYRPPSHSLSRGPSRDRTHRHDRDERDREKSRKDRRRRDDKYGDEDD